MKTDALWYCSIVEFPTVTCLVTESANMSPETRSPIKPSEYPNVFSIVKVSPSRTVNPAKPPANIVPLPCIGLSKIIKCSIIGEGSPLKVVIGLSKLKLEVLNNPIPP